MEQKCKQIIDGSDTKYFVSKEGVQNILAVKQIGTNITYHLKESFNKELRV